MTTQREQLELAARACGLLPAQPSGLGGPCKAVQDGSLGQLVGDIWNPLDSNDDCAAMRARLRLNVTWVYANREDVDPVAVEVASTAPAFRGAIQRASATTLIHRHNNDPEAAERAASVAVAAEIGRGMKE